MRTRIAPPPALLAAALSVTLGVTLGSGLAGTQSPASAASAASATAPKTVDRPPDYQITGDNTKIDSTHYDFATDYEGRTISVTQGGVHVFAKGARGNVAPERLILFTIPDGQFSEAVTVDQDGWIYVLTTDLGLPAQSTVYAFAPGANGAAVPITFTGAALGVVQPIDITDRGDLLAILDAADDGSVKTFDIRSNDSTVVGGISNGSGTQTQVDRPFSLNSDASGRLVLVGQEGSAGPWVGVFGPNANGGVAPERYLEGQEPGSQDLPGFAGFGPKGDLLFSTGGKIRRFVPTATGAAAAATTLTGGGINDYSYMDVTSDGRIVTATISVDTFELDGLKFFADIGPYAKPGKATKLKVAGKATAAKRTITWKPAAAHIDVPVTAQKLRVVCKRAGSKPKTVSTKLSSSAAKFTFELGSFKQGTCTAGVSATNAIGKGAAAKKKFTVTRQ